MSRFLDWLELERCSLFDEDPGTLGREGLDRAKRINYTFLVS